MIYLIANWSEKIKLEGDRISTLSQFFSDGGYENKILLTNPIPFLRYKLNNSVYSYVNIIRIFDIVQNISVEDGHPLTVEEIPKLKEFDKIYTPTAIILQKEGHTVGKVLFNNYGFVSQIEYKSVDNEIIEETFDDRGFLAQKTYFDKDKIIYRKEYLNETGQVTLVQKSDKIIVTDYGNLELKFRSYSSKEEILKEVLTSFFEQERWGFSQKRVPVITTNEVGIIGQIEKVLSNVHVITIEVSQKENFRIQYGKRVVDTVTKRNSDNNKFVIPIFLPELNLGKSNSESLMQVYCKVVDNDAVSQKSIASIMDKVISNEELSLVLEFDGYFEKKRWQTLQQSKIEDYFGIDTKSIDYKNVEKYIIAKRNKKLFTKDLKAVKKIQEKKEWSKYVGAVNANLRVEYIESIDIEKFQSFLQVCRIYIDFEKKYNNLRHSKLVGAGVPIISRCDSDFIVDKKNGFTLTSKDFKENILNFIEYFIDDIDNWNKSLVTSVDIVERYNAEDTMKKWEEVFEYND